MNLKKHKISYRVEVFKNDFDDDDDDDDLTKMLIEKLLKIQIK